MTSHYGERVGHVTHDHVWRMGLCASCIAKIPKSRLLRPLKLLREKGTRKVIKTFSDFAVGCRVGFYFPKNATKRKKKY